MAGRNQVKLDWRTRPFWRRCSKKCFCKRYDSSKVWEIYAQRFQKSEKSSVSYEVIENESKEYMLNGDWKNILKLNAQEAKKNTEKIKKKHRYAIYNMKMF